jgi:predicted nucleotidyltransferase
MTKHDEIENEVDMIRDKIYLTTKEMTPQERVAYINSRAQEVLKRELGHVKVPVAERA